MKTALAPLFDAAANACHQAYGECERVASVTIRTQSLLEMRLDIPTGWTVQEDNEHPRLSNPTAVADVLATLVEVGHRLTREELCEAMAEKGRKRAESVVGEVLAQLMKFGVVDNKQNRNPKGYGVVGD
jgi:hypothetical protein